MLCLWSLGVKSRIIYLTITHCVFVVVLFLFLFCFCFLFVCLFVVVVVFFCCFFFFWGGGVVGVFFPVICFSLNRCGLNSSDVNQPYKRSV